MVDLLKRETPDFISLSLWPASSPDLNPVCYKIWDASVYTLVLISKVGYVLF